MIFEGLTEAELEKAEIWYAKFDKPDQENVSNIIKAYKTWIDEALSNDYNSCDAAFNRVPFFTLYAVGSSITEKKKPSDIDLLTTTNVFVHSKKEYIKPDINKLFELFKGETNKASVKEDSTGKYDWESDSRLTVEIVPYNKELKYIDFIYQYNVLTRSRWETNDRFKRLPLFQIGDPEDTICKIEQYIPSEGWRFYDMPTEIWKIKDEHNKFSLDRRLIT